MPSRQKYVPCWVLSILVLGAMQARAANEAVEARMRKDIVFLASDACEGRGVTTKGINLAADYIANEFKQAGLKPAGADGGYFQPFAMRGMATLGSPNRLVLRGPLGQEIELKPGGDFQVLGLSGSGKAAAPVVFAGYGVTADTLGYDDYKNVDAAGKVVILLRKTPRFDNPHASFAGGDTAYYAELNTKIANAEKHHAAAVLLVNDRETARSQDLFMNFNYTAFLVGGEIPVAHLRRSVVDSMLQPKLDTTLAQLEEDTDRDLRPRGKALAGWTASVETHVNRPTNPAKNIIGVLEGSGRLANETVVLGAHYDHLGYGGFGSLARNLKGKVIHPGADDNASGTTTLIELARRFAAQPQREGRRLVFMAFSGEESGLIGSAYYCKHPIFPLENTVAMINLDMVGRLRPDKETNKDKLIVYGTSSATTFDKLIDSVNAKYDFKLQKVPSGRGPSDQESFYLKQVPVFFFFTGDHSDYHRPGDTSDKINFAGMARVADFVQDLAEYLDTVPQRPQYVKVASPSSGNSRMSGPRLGIRPAYGDDKDGVLLDGVSEGTPAAKAGLKEGDRILEMAGKTIKNLESYMAVMAGHKKGDTFDLGVLRDGKRITLKVTLE